MTPTRSSWNENMKELPNHNSLKTMNEKSEIRIRSIMKIASETNRVVPNITADWR